MERNKIIQGDAREVLETFSAESVDMCITSPPYWGLRDYDVNELIWGSEKDCKHKGYGNFKRGFCRKCGAWKGQLGLEPTFDLYIKHLCDIFDGVKRVLKKTGTCWVNIGDSYLGSNQGYGTTKRNTNTGFQDVRKGYFAASKQKTPLSNYKLKAKCLAMVPFRFALEMVNRGWILRNVIIWHKPNCMPCSVKDRFTIDFEYLFFFSKSKKYYFKQQREPHKKESIERTKHKWDGHREPMSSFRGMDIKKMCHPKGRNKRCVWAINTKSFKGAHFAVYPEDFINIPIKAGCPKNGIVLDPFLGSGTSCLVALKQNKSFLGIELSPDYIKIAKRRIINFLKNGG